MNELTHLADISLRAIAIAGLAALILRVIPNRRSPALQHVVWTAVICGMLGLFTLGTLLPKTTLRILAPPPAAPAQTLITAVPEVETQVTPTPTETPLPAPTRPIAEPFDATRLLTWIWSGITLFFLARLFLGMLLAWRLARRAVPCPSSSRAYESKTIAVPMTVGVISPRILLPQTWREWGSEKLEAVLTHEGAHLRRRDNLWSVIAAVNRSIFWFHPLAWLLERRLSFLAEQACDESSVATTGDRESYTRILIEMALAMDETRGRLRCHALTMASSTHLSRRVESLLKQHSGFSARLTRAACAAIVLTALPILWGAGTIEFDRQPALLGIEIPRWTPSPPLRTLLAQSSPAPAPAKRETSTPAFEIADVHASAKTSQPRSSEALEGGRYQIRTSTMLDLIHIAYGFDPTKIIGGPSWLETDRFDITAEVPENTPSETLHTMLQSLLADRFKLVVHRDTRSVPTWTLTAGPRPTLKPAEGSAESGCTMQRAQGPSFGLSFSCRNITMAAFAAGLSTMRGVDIGGETVLDRTGLQGAWNFDVSWSPIGAPSLPGWAPPITAFEALDKQLGLKLEKQPVPAPVIVVDNVNETPTPNPPDVTKAMPAIPPVTAFDVADVKLADPNSRGGAMEVQPGGRLVIHAETMLTLIIRAFRPDASHKIVGAPDWVTTDRFDIIAKAPPSTDLNPDTLAPMFRTLLEERFKLATHTEVQPVSTYSLEVAKPKLAKADPANRAVCSRVPAPPGTPPAQPLVIACHNTTMAQFAAQLPALSARYVTVPVVDTTGLDGAWDFTFSFSTLVVQSGGRGDFAEPDGTITLFEALEKQLGLKLKEEKRPMPVTVVDHLEEKPTDN